MKPKETNIDNFFKDVDLFLYNPNLPDNITRGLYRLRDFAKIHRKEFEKDVLYGRI